MCGISGIVSPHRRDAIVSMTEAIAHRGPDGAGYYQDERIALGHRRLSIIDLTTGDQPIPNETGDLQLVCNGEIYNSPELRERLIAAGHNFRTTTDVEVILHLYEEHGTNCVRHLRGMFAFALWDRRDGTLFMARDHLGQKPLFYWENGDEFVFASEVKGILASGLVDADIDLEGLWHYVSLRFMPDQHSMFKGIRKLPAATSLHYQHGRSRLERYWNLDFTDKMPADEEKILDQLDALLRDTVRSHLLSDVRLGAFLSGGIDSSLISAMMAEVSGERVASFSIGVKEHGFNELPYSRQVAERYGMEAHEKVVEADLVRLTPLMVHHMDEPADPFGAGVYLVSREARRVVKAVLTGDGGDENFAGYDRFIGQRWVDIYGTLPDWLRRQVVRRIVDRIPETFAYKSFAQKARWMNELSLVGPEERYAHSLGFLRFTREAKEQLFTAEARGRIEDRDSLGKILAHFQADNADHLIDRMLYTDLMTRMPDHLLMTVDRMAMAHGLETRSPFVDYKLVEFAARVPGDLKLKGNRLKYLLRRLAERYMPRQVVHRPKVGFGFPLAHWMRRELRDFVHNMLGHSRFVEQGIFERSYLDRLVAEHMSGKIDHNYRLWLLINLEVWYRLNMEGLTVPEMQDEISRLGASGAPPSRLVAAPSPAP